MFEIQKGIPAPKKNDHSQPSELTVTAQSMEIGDSILVPYTRNYPYTYNMWRRTGFEFVQKKEGKNLRIWRVK